MSEEKAVLISDPWFGQIKDGSKTVEVRGNFGFFRSINAGDSIRITNGKGDTVTCKVKEVRPFPNITDLLKGVGWKTIYPGAESETDAEAIIKRLIKPQDEGKELLAIVFEDAAKSGGRVRSKSKSKTKKKSKSRSRSRSKGKNRK